MSSATTPVKGATAALIVLFVSAALWLLRGYVWPTLSNVEVGPLQAMLDPTLFQADFTVQESLRFSPRFYYNELILLPARAGLPLAWSFAAWHAVALIALVGAVHSVAGTLRLGPLVTAVLLFWLITLGAGIMGGVFLYSPAPVPSVWAGAVAACGAALAVRRRWVAAFACFGAAALLQFLVGFYAGLLALPVLLSAATSRERVLAIVAWGAGLALVYVPLWLTSRGDGAALDNDAFVEIYAQLRHPHHLVPSTWPRIFWERAILFYVGAWYFLHRTAVGRPAPERVLLHGTILLTAAALAANYVFVEIFPSAFVAKLQPARITPLAQAVVLGLLATRVQAALDYRTRLLAVLLCLLPLSLYPGLVLGLAAILGRPEKKPSGFFWPTLVLAATMVVSFRPFGGTCEYFLSRYGPWVLFVSVLLVPQLLRFSRWALLAGTAAAIGGAAYAAHASLQPGYSGEQTRRLAIDAAPSDAPGIVGRRFRDRSAPGALVLVPPTSEPWSFKLYARRAVVVDDKNIPFTTRGLKIWHERMEAVLGVPYTRGIDAAAAWRQRSGEDLRGLAKRYAASHILTRDEWHPELPGQRIDHEQGWSLWELGP